MPIDPTIIEAFIVDPGFVDQSKTINGVLIDEAGKVAALTPKALSYFDQPGVISDKRDTSNRVVNWSAETKPSVIVDETSYSQFVSTVNGMSSSISAGLFKLVDKLLFNFDPDVTRENLELSLQSDPDITDIYVADSFRLSAQIVEGDVYYTSGTATQVDVPSFASFSLNLPQGSSTITYQITLFASVEAWLTGYDISTIVKVVPPLPYDKLYSSSLVSSVDNIFSTASTTASLSYSTTQALLGSVTVSGIREYNAVLVDVAGNTTAVPFNILFKGRTPTLSEIREAIRNELLNSGIGTEEGWEQRIPGVFVAGRFYLVPYWDLKFTKPDQVLFPSINTYTTLGEKANLVLSSTGFGDLTEYLEHLTVYFNRMSVAACPDLTGIVDINLLSSIIPDYQNFSPEEENFAYMDTMTQEFSRNLNTILSIDTGATPQGIYIPITENLLTFYSFVIGRYELCVITKQCYTDIMESIQ